jgi:hypothetical protein
MPKRTAQSASSDKDALDTMMALFISSLRTGSSVEIRDKDEEDLFHGAYILKMMRCGFRYEYKNRFGETGSVRFKDCLKTWRPRG